MIEEVSRPVITLIDVLMFILFVGFIIVYSRAVILWVLSGGHYWALEYLTYHLIQ
jgi:hypothetical protein